MVLYTLSKQDEISWVIAALHALQCIDGFFDDSDSVSSDKRTSYLNNYEGQLPADFIEFFRYCPEFVIQDDSAPDAIRDDGIHLTFGPTLEDFRPAHESQDLPIGTESVFDISTGVQQEYLFALRNRAVWYAVWEDENLNWTFLTSSFRNWIELVIDRNGDPLRLSKTK